MTYGSREPGLARSLALSFLVHGVLLAVLFVGVRFQSSPPASVMVELWEAAPPPPPPPAPVVEPPKPVPPPPKPEPEPQVKKPEIALPEKPKPKPKPEPKPEPKPKPRPEPKPKPDLAFEKQMREQAAQEERQIAQQQQERQLRDLLARQQADALSKALATWTDRIRAKIRGNIILPPDLAGNPEAIFDVTLLPSGEVLTVRKRKSSGHAAYDDAVERAIMKASPLPKPDDASVFRRQLELKFRPQDR